MMAWRRDHTKPVRRASFKPLSADEVGAWMRFLKKARRCAADPVAHGDAFAKAATRVGREFRLPPEADGVNSALVRLIREGKRFGMVSDAARAEAGPEIARLCVEAGATLDRAMDAAQADGRRADREPRRDIYG